MKCTCYKSKPDKEYESETKHIRLFANANRRWTLSLFDKKARTLADNICKEYMDMHYKKALKKYNKLVKKDILFTKQNSSTAKTMGRRLAELW